MVAGEGRQDGGRARRTRLARPHGRRTALEQQSGTSALRFALTGLRLVVGLLFVNSGLAKTLDHAGTAADFAGWGVPLPDLAVYAVGGIELVCGALLVLGVATRRAALPLTAVMAGAALTAGLTDGGAHLVLPPLLALLCALLAVGGGGAGQLRPALRVRPR